MSSDESTTSSASAVVSVQLREVPIKGFNDVLPVLQKTLNQLEHPFIKKAEQISGMEREKLFYIICSLVLLVLMFCPGNMFLSTFITVAYPMHASLLTLNTQNTSEYTQWLVYWCVFAEFCQMDFLFGSINGLLLLYVPLKTVFLLYLALPQTYGAHNMYVKHFRKWITMTNLLDKMKKML
ncbi:hypothetical protein niasHT_014144 [Heterodera trifolii]|uniref:Receptor expression-enhancing protein n=1 Tax=Heterodera trifolii TaxID=157864 RepID=A0ABD2KXN3_9BILA